MLVKTIAVGLILAGFCTSVGVTFASTSLKACTANTVCPGGYCSSGSCMSIEGACGCG